MRKGLYAAVLSAILMGCAASEPFKPNPALGSDPSSAHYEIRTGAGDFGMVRVDLRTGGIQQSGDKKGPLHRVGIQIAVVNDSAQAVTLNAEKLALQLIISNKKQDIQLLPVMKPAQAQIAGKTRETFSIEFTVPADAKVKQINAYEFTWGLILGENNYTQTTGFFRYGSGPYYVYDPVATPYGSFSVHGGNNSRAGFNLGIGIGF